MRCKLRSSPSSPSPSDSFEAVARFWQGIDNDPSLLARRWTLPEMARRCGLGVTRFVAYSRQWTKTSPMKHLRQCRIRLACRLLRDRPERSITQIALDCGFSSSQRLAAVFGEEVGRTPQAYRAAQHPPVAARGEKGGFRVVEPPI